MDGSHFAEVAVIGGGPAGAAAALTLLRYTTHSVMLVEGTRYSRPRPGETVSAALLPLLEYLGAEGVFVPRLRLDAYGTAAAWGNETLSFRQSLFTEGGLGWHLDRHLFDAALSEAVQAAGGKLEIETWLRGVRHEEGCWQLQLERAGVKIQLTAREVIDATGRRASFARLMGARRHVYDNLVGLVSYFTVPNGIELEQFTLVEAMSDGWWYSAPLPGHRAVAVFMTDSDLLQGMRTMKLNPFDIYLAASAHTSARLADCLSEGTPWVHPAESRRLDPCIGLGWVAAGDAAAAFDPLSSLGIGHALTSGIQAARIVDERLRGNEELALAYPTDVLRHVSAFLDSRYRLYAAEQRWPLSPFWARRHAQQAAAPDESYASGIV
jgi:flavin-dependent dehydrogenase